ncbi:hypothetical protein RFI_26307, partial [Reticulomyxa filosa]
MGSQTTTQNSPETETERSQQLTTHSQTLKELPTTQDSSESETEQSRQLTTYFQIFKELSITQNSPEAETERSQQLTTHSQTLKELPITQSSQKRETEQSQQSNTHFQTLKELPTPLSQSPCVLHKNELLICGGASQRACYSYHTLKNEYKLICEYPSDVYLSGHCVVKLVDSNSNNDKDNNQITLLSFGGYNKDTRHTLVMKYIS